jgi:hypothetical protein
MSAPRGKRPTRRAHGDVDADAPEERAEAGGRVPDLLRRVVGMGFSGLFLTEEVVRKALGETLPRDWVDFAAAQSERTRRELIDRVAGEIGRTLDTLDVPKLAERLLQGHAIEVTASVRFVPQPPADAEQRSGRRRAVRVTFADEEAGEGEGEGER